jgi:hypothetical protein
VTDAHPEAECGRAWKLAEQASVQAEINQSLSGQQSILAWSVAAIGILLAATFALSTTGANGVAIRLAVLGAFSPALAIGASFAWIGELFRMERNAVFLRALERSTWPESPEEHWSADHGPPSPEWLRRTPLSFNNFVAFASDGAYRVRIGYVGGALIYLGTVATSLALFAYLLVDQGSCWLRYLGGIAWAASGLLAYTYVLWAQTRAIVNLEEDFPGRNGRKRPDPFKIVFRPGRARRGR